MPPYHHPKLPTDMLANFNDLHAEISALPRSRANHSPSPNLMKPSSGQRRPPMKPHNHDDHINTADALVADAYFRFLTGPKPTD